MRKLLLLTCALFALNWNVIAQDEESPTYYHVLEYMDVAPGMGGDYEALEAVWKKIHAANIKAGKYEGWELSSIIFPYSADRGYNYVVRTVFNSSEQLGAYMEGWEFPDLKELLTAEEIAMVEKTTATRTMVKSEVWTVEDMVASENVEDIKIVVFNFFNNPEGKSTSDHLAVEAKYWKPIHASRVEAGEMAGWGIGVLQLPWGSDYPYQSGTVDFFRSTAEYLNLQGSFMEHFEKVHPGMDINEMMERTSSDCDLISSEVRMILDQVWRE